jgi:hypothetical protein
MSIQSVNSSTVLKPPALGCCGILIEPYKEGGRRLAKGFCKAPAGSPISFCQRIVQVIAGISLLIPVINIVIYVAMRAFCSASKKGQETISASKKKSETIEQITVKKPVTEPKPPVSVLRSESTKSATESKRSKSETQTIEKTDPVNSFTQEKLIFQEKINKAVDAANQAVQKIPKEDIQKRLIS